ncbi:hypothetical protein QBC34DRAFT_421322 [Podospora aff. communis PSN243]|uniref:Zn(2)-C6 fungal-type domain-containing protein n=1 Tax=Podospora aff. communis PSN243 TaxID=3040156 RepID=A0AAV9H455_9PEZI|nr:hypothetical protein QBC34DRAFT_421322 [Podospora aff. communis PSN243]
MDALALLGVAEPTHSISSVADLQERLRSEFNSKVTNTSAKHISEVFELPPSVVFDIPVSEPENEALESAAAVDPLLGGTQSSVAPSLGGAGQPVRRINAIDTLMNQPSDDNALQKSVAKHIISSLSEIDRSHWVIREVSRGDQGWTFTYVCKDSTAAWTRQTSKAPAKVPIGAWSNKDGQDPVNMGRPSFDCRGHVTIAFVKTRKIEIKYEHTPIHKSVSELMDLLVPELPPPAPIPVVNKKAPKEPKPPKTPKTPKEPKAPKAKKRAAEGDAAEGDAPPSTKRRKKKKASEANAADMSGAIPPHGIEAAAAAAGMNGHSEAAGEDAVNGGVPHAILNVSQEEAARRREVAIRLLREKDIDPDTLSTEQFNIFANQSPDLQQESLNMLVRYGAERLRIVHPSKNGSSSAQSTPAPEQQASSSSSAAAANRSQGAEATPSKSKRSRKRKSGPAASDDDSVEVGDGYVAAAAVPALSGKAKLTRGACESCRISKQKCDKVKPTCSQCLGSGLACVYALAKPRPSGVSKGADVEGSSREASVAVEQQDDEPDSLGSPGFHNEQPEIAPAALVSPALETPSTYNHGPDLYDHESGLTFPGAALPMAQEVAQHAPIAANDYMHNPVASAEAVLNDYSYPPPVQEPTMTFPEQPTNTSHVQNHTADLGHQRTRSRRALPSAQPSQSHSSSTNSTQSNGWQAVSNPPAAPPTTTSTRSPRQTRSQQPTYNNARAYDDIRQPDWSAPSQPAQQTANPPAKKSPSQAAAQTVRAKSRQAIRNQNTTPVQNSQPTRQNHGQASTGYPASSGVSNPTTASNYDYSQYSSARAEPSSTVAYEPYSSHPAPTTSSNSYSSYSGYGTRSATANSSAAAAANTASQTVTSSYNATTATAPSASQWGATSSGTQARNTHSYSNNQSSSAATSYSHQSATNKPSPSLQGFDVRPQPTTQGRSSSNAYGHHTQQQQEQQQQQRPRQSQQQAYNNSYSSQPQASTNQQSNWYGFNAVNNPSSGYNTAPTSGNNAYSNTGSHAHAGGSTGSGGSYNQTHRSMNLSSHTYSSMEGGEQALYELLRNNPGSG